MSAHNSERVNGTSGPTKPRASATHQALETLVGRKRRSSRAPKTSLFEVPFTLLVFPEQPIESAVADNSGNRLAVALGSPFIKQSI